MAIGDVIARLAVSLNLETAAFEKNARYASGTVGQMQRTMSKAATAIGGAFAGMQLGAAVSAFRDMGKAALDAAGGLGEQASQLGVTTRALQEFRFIATQVGLSSDEMDQGLSQLTRRLGEAAQGSKEPVEALKQLGLSIDEIKGKDAGDVLPLIAAGMDKIPDPATRAAIAVDLFGKSGQKLMPLFEGGAAQIEAFRKEMAELGIIMSEGDIAKADETADKLAKLNYVIEAQQNKKLLENSEAIVRYEEAIGNFKLALITAVGDLESANQRYNAWALEFNANLRRVINGVVAFQGSLASRFAQVIADVVSVGRNIVLGLARGIRDNAGAVWDALKGVVTSGIARAKNLLGIQSPSRVFMEIGDYIGQGLAIGIEGQSGRVAAATRKMTEAARRAAEETQALFARLFPELEKANQYRDDLKRIDGSGRSADAQAEARRRLGLEAAGYGANDNVPLSDEVMDQGTLITGALYDVSDSFDVFGKKAGSVTVNVAKSFKDMADATLQSLNSLAGAIKGGGFLDILSSVIGLGLQLGSIGAFGKGVAGRINTKVPGYAGGTSFHPGGLAVVGERGPELVHMPRGSSVTPNNALGGGRLQVEVIANNNGFGAIVRNHAGQVIAEAAPAIMDGGARVANARAAYRQTRRVA